MPKYCDKRDDTGFSLLELMIVVAIALTITAIGLPRMSTIIANAKLRASMSSVSGLFQNCRMVAVQQNRTMTAHLSPPATPPRLVYYLKKAIDTTGTLQTSDPQVVLEVPIFAFDSPTGAGAPSDVSAGVLGFKPQTTEPSFNSRGLPCAYDTPTGACPNVGFVKYFKDTRISGSSSGWAAISISPAGRIKRWFWTGSVWTD